MAKITFRGGWVKISSLNKEDKKNYLISITMFFIGAIFWGIHLTSVDGIMGPAQDVEPTSTFFGIIRLFIVFFWSMAVYFYNKFLKTQDELFIGILLHWRHGAAWLCVLWDVNVYTFSIS